MAAYDNDIEKKTRKIVESDVNEGEELQRYQEAQNQLLNIQAAQKENIQVNRAVSSAQEQNNQSMAQAASIMASESSPQVGISPQTSNILQKYGYKGPGTRTSSSSTSYGGPVQGRGVVINNKTENKTTNNIQISSPSPVTKGNGGGLEKFKSWISGTLAKQKAQDEVRERNFNRKEWSLSRSSSKIMNKLEEVGKTIGERMDPRKMANILMDQFKVLMFLLGFQFISKNWKNILHKVSDIEKWIRGTAEYFGISTKNGVRVSSGRSKFVKDLISFLGGDPEGKDGALTVLKNLFKESINLLGERLNIFFEDRAQAVKSIDFPAINPSDGIIGAIQSLGVYLGDILSAIVGGRSGIVQNIKSNIKAIGRAEASGADKEGSTGWIRRDLRFDNVIGMSDVDTGDAAAIAGNKMSSYHYDSSGRLANSETASLVQSNSIAGMITDDQTRKIHTVGVMTGLENLRESANRFGKTLVTEEFMNSLRELIPNFPIKIPHSNYKFIKVKKTDKDYSEEGADIVKEAGTAFLKRAGINAGKNAIGADGLISNAADSFFTGEMIKDPTVQGIKAGVSAAIKKAVANDYKLEMVPASDPRSGVEVPYMDYKTGKIIRKKFFKFYELSPRGLDLIKNRIAVELNNPDFEFDTSSKSSMESIEKRLRELKEKKLKRSGKNRLGIEYSYLREKGIESDYDKVKDEYDKLSEYDKGHEDRERAWDEKFKDSQPGRFVSNVGDKIEEAGQWIENAYSSVTGTKNQRQFVNQFRPLYRDELKRRGFDPMFTDILVAQAGLESGWGNSKLSKNYYNYGGIKAGDGENSVIMSTQEYNSETGMKETVKAKFKIFNSPEDYVRYHVDKLNRIWDAFSGNSINDFINRIIGGGLKYATDPEYGSKLANVFVGVKKITGEGEENEAEVKKYSKVQMKDTPIALKKESPSVISSPANKRLEDEFKVSTPIINKTDDVIKPSWGNLSSIDGYINDLANKVKGTTDGSSTILEELRSVNKSITSQSKSLAMLSTSVSELAVVAATNGNNTTVINSGGNNKQTSQSYTKGPNDWVTKGALDISRT